MLNCLEMRRFVYYLPFTSRSQGRLQLFKAQNEEQLKQITITGVGRALETQLRHQSPG